MLPLTWLAPAIFLFSNLFGDPYRDPPAAWAMLLLPLFVGAPSGWVLRPLGILAWLWIPLNVVLGLFALAFLGVIAMGA